MVGTSTDYGISGGGAGYGFGGWGGGFGGIAPVGLFGLIGADGFGRRHDGKGDCDCTKHQLDMIDSNIGDMRTQINLDARFNDVNGNLNSRFNSVEAKQNTMQIEGRLDGIDTRLDTFKDFALTEFGNVKTGIALTGKDIVISEKNIIHNDDLQFCGVNRNIDNKFAALQHNMDKCCCELKTEGLKNTQVILDKLCDQETARLRDEVAELRAFRNNRVIADHVSTQVAIRATTNGSNFNTGVQSQSNNSGQIVG